MKAKTLDKLVWAIRYMEKTAKANDLSLENVASICLGLDDMRHNRMYVLDMKTMKTKKVPGYGKPRRRS